MATPDGRPVTFSTRERIDQPLGVNETQARQFPNTPHGVDRLSARQQVIDFSSALLVQECNHLFANSAVGFLPGRSRYADWTGP